MVCNVVTYRARSAVREVGVALGFPRPLVDRVAKALETYDSVMVRRDLEAEGGFAEFFQVPGRARHGPSMAQRRTSSRGAAGAEARRVAGDGMGQLNAGARDARDTGPARSATADGATGDRTGPEASRPFAWLTEQYPAASGPAGGGREGVRGPACSGHQGAGRRIRPAGSPRPRRGPRPECVSWLAGSATTSRLGLRPRAAVGSHRPLASSARRPDPASRWPDRDPGGGTPRRGWSGRHAGERRVAARRPWHGLRRCRTGSTRPVPSAAAHRPGPRPGTPRADSRTDRRAPPPRSGAPRPGTPGPAERRVAASSHARRLSVAGPEPPPQPRGGTVGTSAHWDRWLEFCARIDGFPRHLSIHAAACS